MLHGLSLLRLHLAMAMAQCARVFPMKIVDSR
jgi:hypothetical protein